MDKGSLNCKLPELLVKVPRTHHEMRLLEACNCQACWGALTSNI